MEFPSCTLTEPFLQGVNIQGIHCAMHLYHSTYTRQSKKATYQSTMSPTVIFSPVMKGLGWLCLTNLHEQANWPQGWLINAWLYTCLNGQAGFEG
eukprot:1161269-Pelagomonas_calceolata.AAC.16